MPQAPVQNETYIGTENFAAGMNDSDSVHLVPPNALTTIKNLLVDGGDLKAASGTTIGSHRLEGRNRLHGPLTGPPGLGASKSRAQPINIEGLIVALSAMRPVMSSHASSLNDG